MTLNLDKYKEGLLHLRGEYQKKINLNRKISFGLEIEFAGIEFYKIFKYIDTYINKIENNSAFEYRIWNIINESTVEKIIDGKTIGGEIVSPILYNDEEFWKSIEKITRMFNLSKFYFSEDCAFHVHFGEKNFRHLNAKTSYMLCNPKFISNVFKMWMIFEDIIYRMCYGTKLQERPKIMKYAKPTGKLIYEKMNFEYDEEQIMEFVSEYRKDKDNGLNLKNLKYLSKKTIEIRCPNPMETKFLIQNTIRFLARLLQYCDSTEFDDEKIKHYINNYIPMNIEDFKKEKYEKAKDLADMIYDNELDKMYFMKQYLKCFTNEDLTSEPQKQLN